MIQKYRGKCRDGGWIKGSLVKFDGDTCFIMPELNGASTLSYTQIFNHTAQYVDIETVGQSIGKCDKNGVEVFKGDIVKCTRGCPHEIIRLEEYGGTFLGGMPTWYLSGLQEGYAWTGEEEVIGNIYDNPELLKDQV